MLRTPILHDTGFFCASANDAVRLAQGLPPQSIASMCYLGSACEGPAARPITFPYYQQSPAPAECAIYTLNTRAVFRSNK
jgi:hypothetical protein